MCIRGRRDQKEEQRKISAWWEAGPHARDREMASTWAPGALRGPKAPWDWPLIPKLLLQPNLVQLLDLITLLCTIGILPSPIRDEY